MQRSCQGSQTATGRQRATRAQTLTARTPWYGEGNSKPALHSSAGRIQQAKRVGVRDGSPKGRDTIGGSMRSTTARPGLPGDARKSVNRAMRLYSKTSKPQKQETIFTHLRKPTEPYIRKSDLVPIHESGFTYLRQVVYLQTHKSAKQVTRKKARNIRRATHLLGLVKRPATGRGVRATLSRPCCATRSDCACRPRPPPGGRRWSPGTTDHPGSPIGRAAAPPC